MCSGPHLIPSKTRYKVYCVLLGTKCDSLYMVGRLVAQRQSTLADALCTMPIYLYTTMLA